MYDNLYCKMFIDTDLIYEELFELVLKFVDGKKQAVTYIIAQWCDISVQKNREYDAERYLFDSKNFSTCAVAIQWFVLHAIYCNAK